MAARLLTFEELWTLVSATNQSSNGICYHTCCDIWTTRGCNKKRTSHLSCLKWQKLSSTLDKSCEDKKQALQAKINEEGWRLPAVLNEPCLVQPSLILHQKDAFRLDQPDIKSHDLQAGLSSLDFIYSDQPSSEMVTPLSMYYFT